MNPKDFGIFKKRVSDHLYNEAELATVILGELSEEQAGEIHTCIVDHPFSKTLKEIKEIWKKLKEKEAT